jgi:hypothetical protein
MSEEAGDPIQLCGDDMKQLRATFAADGFLVLPSLITKPACTALNNRLEDILRGKYDLNCSPDKGQKSDVVFLVAVLLIFFQISSQI